MRVVVFRMNEPVTGTDFGEKVARVRGIIFEFFSKLANMDSEEVPLVAGISSHGFGQELIGMDDVSDIAGENVEKLVLDSREVEKFAAACDAFVEVVDVQVAEFTNAVGLGFRGDRPTPQCA